MAAQNITDVLTRINSTGNLTGNQKETLRTIAENNPKIVLSTSDLTVNTTTTLASHTALSFSVKAGRKYLFESVLFTTVDGTDGIKVAWASGSSTDPTAVRIFKEYIIDNAAVQTEVQTDVTSPTATGVAAAIQCIKSSGYIKAAVDTTITLQSALVADNNAATTIHAGSYIKVYEVA
jgi:hypothetical protein